MLPETGGSCSVARGDARDRGANAPHSQTDPRSGGEKSVGSTEEGLGNSAGSRGRQAQRPAERRRSGSVKQVAKRGGKGEATASPDKLTRSSGNGQIELTEEELGKVAGAGLQDKRKDKIII